MAFGIISNTKQRDIDVRDITCKLFCASRLVFGNTVLTYHITGVACCAITKANHVNTSQMIQLAKLPDCSLIYRYRLSEQVKEKRQTTCLSQISKCCIHVLI